MIVKFFRDNQPLASVLLVIILAGLWAEEFVHVTPFDKMHKMPLFDLITFNLPKASILTVLSSIALILSGGFFLNLVVNRNDLVEKRTQVPGLIYATLLSCSPGITTLHPVLLANIFLIFGFGRLIGIYRKEHVFSNIFDAGLFFSLASLAYFPSVALFPAIWIGLLIFHSFNWREWLIVLFGIICPYLFALVFYFWYDSISMLWYDKIIYIISNSPDTGAIKPPVFWLIGALFFTTTFALVKAFETIGTGTVKSRKAFIFLMWFTLFAFVSVFVSPTWTFRDFTLLAIPFTVFISNYFINITRNWMAEFIYIVIICCIIYVRLAT